MKKVRKQDLEELIALCYKESIEVTDYEFKKTVVIDINSIYITVMDYREFDDVKAKMKLMQDFAKHLKAISFGKLKVTRKKAKKDGNSCFSLMYIANAYEIESDDKADEIESDDKEDDVESDKFDCYYSDAWEE